MWFLFAAREGVRVEEPESLFVKVTCTRGSRGRVLKEEG